MVSGESTATVTRADPAATNAPKRFASNTWLANNKSPPKPAAAMPSTSATVAQQNAVWPALAKRCANVVDLNAFTWGRKANPGRRAAMVATLASKTVKSATKAGVTNSLKCIAACLS